MNNHLSKLDTPPWYVIDGRHPRIRLAMVCVKQRLGGVSNIFYALYMISKTWKALAHDLIPASLCEGPFFYFMLSQFTYFFLS